MHTHVMQFHGSCIIQSANETRTFRARWLHTHTCTHVPIKSQFAIAEAETPNSRSNQSTGHLCIREYRVCINKMHVIEHRMASVYAPRVRTQYQRVIITRGSQRCVCASLVPLHQTEYLRCAIMTNSTCMSGKGGRDGCWGVWAGANACDPRITLGYAILLPLPRACVRVCVCMLIQLCGFGCVAVLRSKTRPHAADGH